MSGSRVEQPVDRLEARGWTCRPSRCSGTPAPRADGRRAACGRSRLRLRGCAVRVRAVARTSWVPVDNSDQAETVELDAAELPNAAQSVARLAVAVSYCITGLTGLVGRRTAGTSMRAPALSPPAPRKRRHSRRAVDSRPVSCHRRARDRLDRRRRARADGRSIAAAPDRERHVRRAGSSRAARRPRCARACAA